MKKNFLSFVLLVAAIPGIFAQQKVEPFNQGREALYSNKLAMVNDLVANNPLSVVCYMENIGLYNKQTDMIVKSLENYFQKGYSFSEQSPVKTIPVIILYKTNTTRREIKTESTLIKDSTGEILNSLLYKQKIINTQMDRTYSNSTADLYVLDNQQRIRHSFSGFHSFGEELRPFERMVRKLAGDTIAKPFIDLKMKDSFLREGALAPDFEISKGLNLYELTKTKKVVISFYPAPFTGAGLRYEEVPEDTLNKNAPKISTKKFDQKLAATSKKQEKEFTGGCGGQAIYLERVFNRGERENASQLASFADTNVVVLYISEGNPEMLKNWGRFLGTGTLKYVNDPGFVVAQKFGSYNYTTKLNKRSIFVIDHNNKVKLVNYNMEYFYNMSSAINAALE